METKRLVVQISAELHKRIKVVAAEKNVTISWWIMEAIKEKQEKDKSLGF